MQLTYHSSSVINAPFLILSPCHLFISLQSLAPSIDSTIYLLLDNSSKKLILLFLAVFPMLHPYPSLWLQHIQWWHFWHILFMVLWLPWFHWLAFSQHTNYLAIWSYPQSLLLPFTKSHLSYFPLPTKMEICFFDHTLMIQLLDITSPLLNPWFCKATIKMLTKKKWSDN